MYGDDSLNLGGEQLFVLRKDGHYDRLYRENTNELFNKLEEFKDLDPEFKEFYQKVKKFQKGEEEKVQVSKNNSNF